MIKDVELLEKYNKTWGKVSNRIKKGFDSGPVYNEKYLKTKIKSYQGKSALIPTMIKYQKKVFNIFVYW